MVQAKPFCASVHIDTLKIATDSSALTTQESGVVESRQGRRRTLHCVALILEPHEFG